MMRKINRDWQLRMISLIEDGKFISETIPFNLEAKWLISILDAHRVPFKVNQLGAGVKKIMVMDNICPYCDGRGYKGSQSVTKNIR